MTCRTLFRIVVGSAAVANLPAAATAQPLSEHEALEFARTRASIALALSAQQLGTAETSWSQRRNAPGTWSVSFGSGASVLLRDDRSTRDRVISGLAPNLSNLLHVEPFVPAYRSSEEALEYARSVAARCGMSDFVVSPTSPPTIPVPARGGRVQCRRASVSLYPTPFGYPSVMGGDRIEITFDTLDLALETVMVVESYEFEPPAGPPIAAGEATRAFTRATDAGEIERTSGPFYYEVLSSGTVPASGQRYAGRRFVPLVFLVRGSRQTGVVHAVTGEVLRYRSSLVAGASLEGSPDVRSGSSSPRPRSTAAVQQPVGNNGGLVAPWLRAAFVAGCLLTALTGGAAWYLLRRRRARGGAA